MLSTMRGGIANAPRAARAPHARAMGVRTNLQSWIPKDEEALEKAAVASVLHEYSQRQLKTAEMMVPWFLTHMPAAYFRLVGDEDRLSHLQAAAGLFDDATGKISTDDDLEFRMVAQVDATHRHVTYARAGDRPGTLQRQVGAIMTGATGALEGVKVFTSDDETLCLNVFELATGEPDRTFASSDAEESALGPLLAYAEQRRAADPDDAFWSPEAVEAHAGRCLPQYMQTTAPERWHRQRKIFHSIQGTESVGVRCHAAEEEDGGGHWITMAAPNVLPANFLHKVLMVLAGMGLDVKRCHLDNIRDEETTHECAMLRVLATPCTARGFAVTEETYGDLEGIIPRIKWLDDVALDMAIDAADPLTNASAVKHECMSALASLAHRSLSKTDALAYSSTNVRAITHGPNAAFRAIASDAATLLLQRTAPGQLSAEDRDRGVSAEDLYARIEEFASTDIAARAVLRSCATHAATCLGSNAGSPGRYSFTLSLDPREMSAAMDDAPTPYGVIFCHGRRFDGFHVRFRPIARGGMRLVTPRSPEAFAHSSARHFDECFNLAFAQQLKNKDIPEGGSKGVMLVDATPPTGATSWVKEDANAFHSYLCRKSCKAFTDGILDLCLDEANQLPMVYLGPDEQVLPEDINWVIDNAHRRGHPTPDAFMSSKPDAGINHKEFGVTSEGVHVFLEEAVRQSMGIDPKKDAFTVKITGGPDGDVAGNAMLILFRECAGAKVVGVADGFGVAQDPDGLDRAELTRLVNDGAPITSFDASKLGPRGELVAVVDAETSAFRDTMHNRVRSDVFLPGGGRPNTLNAANYAAFCGADGAPSSPIVVEGANLYVTPECRDLLYQTAGVKFVKDSSANKAGVICSSYEILSAHLLNRADFEEQKPTIVGEIVDKLKELAQIEADLLFREHNAFPGALPEFSARISNAINAVTDAVADEMDDGKATPLFLELAPEHMPATLAALAVANPGNLPKGYITACVASFVATRLVYAEGLAYVEALGVERLAEVALNYVESQRDVATARDAVMGAYDLDDDTKAKISELLRPRVH